MIIKIQYNKIPSWLWGGTVSVLIAILLFLLTEFVPNQCTFSSNVQQCYNQLYFVLKPLWSLMLSLDLIGLFICRGFCPAMNFTNLFTIWPSYFFIGSVLGWIYGRLKPNNFLKRSGVLLVFISILISLFSLWYSDHKTSQKGTTLKKYENSTIGISYEYPGTWTLSEISSDGSAVGDWVTQLITPDYDKQINLAFYPSDTHSCWHGNELAHCKDSIEYAQSNLYENIIISTYDGNIVYLGKDDRNRKAKNPQSYAAFIENHHQLYEFTFTSSSGASEKDPEYADFISILKSASFLESK